ncbi:mitotic interactor and substrate of PLK1-like isoform X1 [Hemiscyllium ocellatum]|uniref:mitotic interactor and substrate of PLK1-like isoform X1 n=1 Tax=Hemiscyllium ocellatum TaxID=170820 RepID=UPI002965FE20|nr:mitotic interactor and substrate of PLK1-like isoform X1 [Hemiscyllium ocellatum]
MLKYTPPWQALCQARDQQSKKQVNLETPIEVSVVNEVRSQPSVSLPKDLALRNLTNLDPQPVGIPEGELVQSQDSEQDRDLSKDTREISNTGSRNRLQQQVDNELVLKEGGDKESDSLNHPQWFTQNKDSLEEQPSDPMEKTEGNVFATNNGSLLNFDYSCQSPENGTHLLSHNPNTITLITSGSSVSDTPASRIDDSNDVIIHATKVSVIQHPDVDDHDSPAHHDPFSSKTQQDEDWIHSTKVATIKSEANFDLRTYHVEKKPTKLFPNDEGEKYRAVVIKGTADDEALMKERKQIIRNQAMKKNATIAEKWGSAEQLNMEEKPSLADSGQKHDKVEIPSTETNASPFSFSTTHSEGINTEQINFTAARQQFLEMEKSQPEIPLSPRPSPRILNQSSRPSESMYAPHYKADTSPGVTLKAIRVECFPDEEREHPEKPFPKSNGTFIATKATVENGDGESQHSLPVYSSLDDLDSGLGEMSNDCSYGYTSDGGASTEILNTGTDNSGAALESPELKHASETPIQREIRLAMEREDSLRKERGIKKSSNSEEMVEIRTKPLLSQLPPASPFSKSKDKNRMVFFVQRDIEMESKREEKLREEGKVQGLYDKGTPEEVEKRKKVFEQQVDDVPVVPQQGLHSKVTTPAPQDPGAVHSLPVEDSTIKVDPTEYKVILREYPDYQLNSKSSPKTYSSKLDSPSHSTRLVENWTTPSEEPYILRPLKSQTTFLIEREIEEEQRREEELRAQRQRQQPALNLDSTARPDRLNSTDNLMSPGQPSIAGTSDGDHTKDFTETIQKHERQKGKPWEKKDDTSYAGIEASDDVNIEVLESTRVTRRQSALAQRWEAGIFHNHLEE